MKHALALLAFLLLAPATAHDAGEVTVEVDDDGMRSVSIEGFELSWSALGLVEMTMSAPTTGWLAVGFGGGPAMDGSDLVIAYVDDDGEVHVRDDWGTGPVSHAPDTELGGAMDVSPEGGSESDGRTIVSFTRPQDTGGEHDFVIVPGSTVRLLVAWGRDGADDFDSMHDSAHTAMIEL